MFNISKIRETVFSSWTSNQVGPDAKLFIFSDIDGGDIVNFNLEKWETKVEDYRNGDIINVVKSIYMGKKEFEAMHEIYYNIFRFNNMRFEKIKS